MSRHLKYDIGDTVKYSGGSWGIYTIYGYTIYSGVAHYVGIRTDGLEKDLNPAFCRKIS